MRHVLLFPVQLRKMNRAEQNLALLLSVPCAVVIFRQNTHISSVARAVGATVVATNQMV